MTKLPSPNTRHALTTAAVALALTGGALFGGAVTLQAQDPGAATPDGGGGGGGGRHWRHHRGGGGGGPMGHALGRARAELGLTDAQVQQMREIVRAAQPTIRPLVEQLIAEKRALRPLVQAATVDEPAIRAQAAKVAAVEAEVAVQRAKTTSQLRGVLTPEQVEEIQGFQSRMDGKLDGFLGRFFNQLSR